MAKRTIKGLIKISPLRDKMKDRPKLSTYNLFFNTGEGLSKGQITEILCIVQKEAANAMAWLEDCRTKADK